MFTVIIAEKGIVEMYKKFHMFLAPLDSRDVVFCEWNREGESLEEMLPKLYDTIALRSEWRAIIVNEDGLQKINPFNYNNYVENYKPSGRLNWERLKARRQERLEKYQEAIQNPLTKLTSALCGAPVIGTIIQDRQMYQNILSGQMELYEYMLQMKMQKLDLKNLAAHLRVYQRYELNQFVREEDVDELLDALEASDAPKILSMIGQEMVIEFIETIGKSDPYFSDPEYMECMVENTMKMDLFAQIQSSFHLKDHSPTEVICVSPRTFDFEAYDNDVKWKDKDESEYSRFAEFNLYPEKLKYVVFDVLPEEHKQYRADQLRMLCFLLVVAGNQIPYGIMANGKVYRGNVELEADAIGRFCLLYTEKLKATAGKIRELEYELKQEQKQKLDNDTARRLFESDINIPVKINTQLSEDGLYAEYSKIGLSGNCPRDEYSYWLDQYHSIKKLFVRYLREPRRAVKTAVKEDFHGRNAIEDERVLLLNEYQKEDVAYRLLEEEQNMIETVTTQLFNTKEYHKKMDEADKELKRMLLQRMSRKKTLLVALVAASAYLIGFLPMLLGNLNTVKSFLFSLSLTGIAIGIFLLIGFIFLFVLRKRLINRFKHFNYVVSGICDEIERSLASFSSYLSHACNMMREFSVLNFAKREEHRKENILKKHQLDVVSKINEINTTFSNYISPELRIREIPEPFEYDFTVMANYDYDMPCSSSKKTIKFLQPGHQTTVSVDYMDAVTLTREELYD